jgi:mRNA interferase RelE/StbE
MAWKIEFNPKVEKQFLKLDAPIKQRILRFLDERIRNSANPRAVGEALEGSELGEFWKYRVGDYRLVCHIQDQTVTITVVKVGHRGAVYRKR